MADKIAVARALREMGMLLEVKGENPFKVRAYENGARALEELPGNLDEVVAAGTLTDLPGIGEALAKKIEELFRTGRLEILDRLRAEMPAGVGEMLRIPDLGPKKVAALLAALGIGSVAELEAACLEGRVREVKGFGEKTERKILDGIQRMRDRLDPHPSLRRPPDRRTPGPPPPGHRRRRAGGAGRLRAPLEGDRGRPRRGGRVAPAGAPFRCAGRLPRSGIGGGEGRHQDHRAPRRRTLGGFERPFPRTSSRASSST